MDYIKTIGLLAMQGAFKKHGEIIQSLGHRIREVRTPDELNGLDGIIIPGGESTTIYKLLEKSKLFEPLKSSIENGLPVLGTCAGTIILAKKLQNSDQPTLDILDITVERNSYGRQLESFEAIFKIKDLGENPMNGIFIRAPRILNTGNNVEILAEYEENPILVRQNKIIAATFHPELTDDKRIHSLFLENID